MTKTRKKSPPTTTADSMNRASQLYKNGEFSKAIELCNAILAKDKNDISALNLLGQIDFQTQNFQRALEYYEKALSIAPTSGITLNNTGRVFETVGNYSKALEFYKQAAEKMPETPEVLVNLGNTSAALNHVEETISYYKQALKLRPNYAEVHSNLGNFYFHNGDIDNAIKHCRKAIKINPKLAEAHNNLGNALEHHGQLEQAIQCYRKAVKLKPDYSCAHSNLLLGIHYSDGIPPDEVFNEHKKYALNHCDRFTRDSHTDHDTSTDRIIRIGYISPDFRGHPVASFIKSVIAGHDRSHFKIYCYSDVVTPDSWTEVFKKLSDCFRPIKGFSHADVASLIKKDQIDILVDLAGHTADNRIPMLAMKPAPIQITYLGYPGTTGLDSIDYRLTDHIADPEGLTEKYHTERLLRMPGSFLCYTPPADTPAIEKDLSERSNKITFGSFNNRSKINESVIKTWAEILKNVPDATLFLKAKSLADHKTQKLLVKLFKKHKISHKRLQFSGFVPDAADHMQLYNKVDIALDTFPYNGTTTTCEALWMGVPVITLEGNTHASRVGTTILSNTGLEALIAKDRSDYVKKACSLANDPDRLAQLKSGLRQQIEDSGFIDSVRFTRELEKELSTVWRNWCATRHDIAEQKEQQPNQGLNKITENTMPQPSQTDPGKPEIAGERKVSPPPTKRKSSKEALYNAVLEVSPSLSFTILEIGALPIEGDVEPFHELIDYFPESTLVAFEVDEKLCHELNAKSKPNITYYPVAVAQHNEERFFYDTVHPMCGSLYRPNEEFLRLYQNLDVAMIDSISTINTVSLDDFTRTNNINDVDFIKIDIQGAELEVFKGGGKTLENVISIVSEVEFVPLYVDQPLFGDICSHLSKQNIMFHKFLGMAGRTLRPVYLNNDPNFCSQQMWSDAMFIKDIIELKNLDSEKLLKLGILSSIYNSPDLAYFCFKLHDEKKGTNLSDQALNK